MKPTVGRIVHYTPEWAGPRGNANTLPAIIIEVLAGEECRVGVFGNSAYYTALATHTEPDDTPVPGSWFWPPRES